MPERPRIYLHLRDLRLAPPARWPEVAVDELPGAPAPPARPAAHRDPKPDKVALRVLPGTPPWRPRRRGDCLPGGRNEARPCPYATCRFSLLADVGRDPETGAIFANETGEVDQLPQTCALDVADTTDEGGRHAILRSLEPYFGVTRERVRQLELRALASLRDGLADDGGVEIAEMLAALDRENRRAPRRPKEE